MGDDFIEIYFIWYYNLYITYYTILAVGSTIYSYAVLYNCYYRTYFPPKETLNHYWIFKTFAALGIKFRTSPILDKCSTTEPCASSNSAPLISHLPISPKLPTPWIHQFTSNLNGSSLDSYYWWSQRICGPSCLTSFSVCKVPSGFSCFTILFLFITGYDSTLYFWSTRHKSVQHWVFVFLGFFERGLALFKLKKTLQQHVTAVFLSTKGHKLTSLGMLRQAFSSTEALMHRQPTLIFFPPYLLGGRYWLPFLSQHYFRLWSLKNGSPYLDELTFWWLRKNRRRDQTYRITWKFSAEWD